MVFTDYGREQMAIRMGSNVEKLSHFAIGSGSGAVAVSNYELVNEWDRKPIESFNYSGAQDLTVIADWTSTQISGCLLKEFGAFTTGLDLIGSCWSREGFANVTFDGTNELQIEITYSTF